MRRAHHWIIRRILDFLFDRPLIRIRKLFLSRYENHSELPSSGLFKIDCFLDAPCIAETCAGNLKTRTERQHQEQGTSLSDNGNGLSSSKPLETLNPHTCRDSPRNSTRSPFSPGRRNATGAAKQETQILCRELRFSMRAGSIALHVLFRLGHRRASVSPRGQPLPAFLAGKECCAPRARNPEPMSAEQHVIM